MENDIRDIKGLVAVPYPWWVWALLAFVIVAIVLIAWLIRHRKSPVATETVALPTAIEIALAALQKLRSENPPVEEFYTRLADIVRQFIEGQFGLHAPERTTEEFLSEAKLPAESLTLLGAFLQEADLVKFARHRPGQDDRERALGAAEKFVRESVGRASLPASQAVPETARQEPRPPKSIVAS